ncbi:MAG: hypothetical protein HQL72_04230 [Magnetococcales bacterium]|nr:hypothetical protein [Magnetococcales bacterium]
MSQESYPYRLKSIETDPDTYTLSMIWMDGKTDTLDYRIIDRAFPASKPFSPDEFIQAKITHHGWAIEWPNGRGISTDTLQDYARRILPEKGVMTAEHFAHWMGKHDLSLARAANRLGVSRRTVANYKSGEAKVPKAIWLATLAIDAGLDEKEAA